MAERESVFGMGAWGAGVLVGVLAALAYAGWWKASSGPLKPEKPHSLELVTHGEGATRAGAARIHLTPDMGPDFTQVCRGRCDDLRAELGVSANAVGIEVLDGQGRRLATGQPIYMGSIVRWSVDGDTKVRLKGSYLSLREDGRYEETLLAEPAPAAETGRPKS